MQFITEMRDAFRTRHFGIIGVGLVMLAVAFVLLAVAGWGIFVAADSWCLPRQYDTGMVVSKTFTPAHTETDWSFSAGTGVSMLEDDFYKATWKVKVVMNGRCKSMFVSQELFDSLSENTPIITEFVSGRFSGNTYLKRLSCPSRHLLK